jgi:hypothetical protein
LPLALPVWLAASTAVSAQQPAAARTMLTSVLDRSGRPTVDVGPDDFVVEEGHDEREVLDVRVADYPVVVLLDNGGEADATLATMRQAAVRFITRIGQRPVAVGTLADPPEFVATFDDDRERVLERLDQIRLGPARALLPLSAVGMAAEMIARTAAPFSVVVVLSARPVDPSEQGASERITPVLESGAAVQVIALRAAGSAPPEGAADLLRALADQTRGQYVTIYSPASYGIAIDRLADRLSTEILIEYLVPPGSTGDDARLGIRVPGARVTGVRGPK